MPFKQTKETKRGRKKHETHLMKKRQKHQIKHQEKVQLGGAASHHTTDPDGDDVELNVLGCRLTY